MKTDENSPVYVIAGAYGGLGIALARRLSALNARLCLLGRDEEKLSAVADQFDSLYMVADASDFDELSSCMESCKERFGKVDGVACTVGSLFIKPAHLTRQSDWDAVLTANLSSAFSVLRASAKAMMGRGGSVVLLSSCAARVGMANHDALAAAKAGVEGLVRSAAASYARHGVRVNCVAPGIMNTPLAAKLARDPAVLDSILQAYPIPRMGTPDEVATVIEWLLSPQSGWVTGQSVAVDGGISTLRSSAQKPVITKGSNVLPVLKEANA